MSTRVEFDRPLIPGVRAPLSPSQLWRILWARRWLIAGVVLAFVMLAMAMVLFFPKNYAGSVSLVIDVPNEVPGSNNNFPTALAKNYVATQVDLLTSDKVLSRVVRQQHLADSKKARAAFAASSSSGESFERWLAHKLSKSVKVKTGSTSRFIELRYIDHSPQHAATMANAVVRAYQHVSEQTAAAPAKARLNQYTHYLDTLSAKVDSAQRKLTQAQQRLGIISIDHVGTVDTHRLNDLGVLLNKAQADRQTAQAKVKRIQQLQRKGRPVTSQADVLDSELVQQLKNRLVGLQSKRAKLANTLGAHSPKMQSLAAQIETVRRHLRHEVNAYLQSNKDTAETATARVQALRHALTQQRQGVLNRERKRDQVASLMRHLSSAKQVYQAALKNYGQVDSGSWKQQYNISVISWAVAPHLPNGLGGKKTLLLALIAGSLVGIALALMLELLNRRIRAAEDVTRELDLAVFGELPVHTDRER